MFNIQKNFKLCNLAIGKLCVVIGSLFGCLDAGPPEVGDNITEPATSNSESTCTSDLEHVVRIYNTDANVHYWNNIWLGGSGGVEIRWSSGTLFGRYVRLGANKNDQHSEWVLSPRGDGYWQIATNDGSDHCLEAPSVAAATLGRVWLHAASCNHSKDLQGWAFDGTEQNRKIRNKVTTLTGNDRCIANRPWYGTDLLMESCGSNLGRERNNVWVVYEGDTGDFLRRLDPDGDSDDEDFDDDGDKCLIDPDDNNNDPLQCPDMPCNKDSVEACRNLAVSESDTPAGCVNTGSGPYCIYELDDAGVCNRSMVKAFTDSLFGLDLGDFCGVPLESNFLDEDFDTCPDVLDPAPDSANSNNCNLKCSESQRTSCESDFPGSYCIAADSKTHECGLTDDTVGSECSGTWIGSYYGTEIGNNSDHICIPDAIGSLPLTAPSQLTTGYASWRRLKVGSASCLKVDSTTENAVPYLHDNCGNANQVKWEFIYHNSGEAAGHFLIRNRYSQKCLSWSWAPNGGAGSMAQKTCNTGNKSQRFSIHQKRNGKYLLINRKWNTCLSNSSNFLTDCSLADASVDIEFGFRSRDLVRGPAGDVYIIKNGKRLWISSPAFFASCGFNWSQVQNVSTVELENIPRGLDLAACPN